MTYSYYYGKQDRSFNPKINDNGFFKKIAMLVMSAAMYQTI